MVLLQSSEGEYIFHVKNQQQIYNLGAENEQQFQKSSKQTYKIKRYRKEKQTSSVICVLFPCYPVCIDGMGTFLFHSNDRFSVNQLSSGPQMSSRASGRRVWCCQLSRRGTKPASYCIRQQENQKWKQYPLQTFFHMPVIKQNVRAGIWDWLMFQQYRYLVECKVY